MRRQVALGYDQINVKMPLGVLTDTQEIHTSEKIFFKNEKIKS
jgi:hypothetical protein